MTQKDGSLRPTGSIINQSCTFELKPQHPHAGVQIISHEKVYEGTMSGDVKSLAVTWDEEEYEVMDPKKGMFFSRFLTGWIRWRCSLTNRRQRLYLAKVLGEFAEFLLVYEDCPVLSSNLAVMMVLFAIAVQRLEEAGVSIDLKTGSGRKELLNVLQRVLKEARLEQQTEALMAVEETECGASGILTHSNQCASNSLSAVSFGRTFTHKARVSCRAATAEEMLNALGMLKAMGSKFAFKFIKAVEAILYEEQMSTRKSQAVAVTKTNVTHSPPEPHSAPTFSLQGNCTCASESQLNGTVDVPPSHSSFLG